VSGSKPCIGRDLAGGVEVLWSGEFSKDDGGRAVADARDGAKEFASLGEFRIAGENRLDFCFKPFDGSPKVFNVLPYFGKDKWIVGAAFEAVFLLLNLLFAHGQEAGEFLQVSLSRGRGMPQRWVLFAAEERDQCAVDRIVLVSA